MPHLIWPSLAELNDRHVGHGLESQRLPSLQRQLLHGRNLPLALHRAHAHGRRKLPAKEAVVQDLQHHLADDSEGIDDLHLP